MTLGWKRRKQIGEIFRRLNKQDLFIESEKWAREKKLSRLQTLRAQGIKNSVENTPALFQLSSHPEPQSVPSWNFLKLPPNARTLTASAFLCNYRKPRDDLTASSQISCHFWFATNSFLFCTNHSSRHSSFSAISSPASSSPTQSQFLLNSYSTVCRVMINCYLFLNLQWLAQYLAHRRQMNT